MSDNPKESLLLPGSSKTSSVRYRDIIQSDTSTASTILSGDEEEETFEDCEPSCSTLVNFESSEEENVFQDCESDTVSVVDLGRQFDLNDTSLGEDLTHGEEDSADDGPRVSPESEEMEIDKGFDALRLEAAELLHQSSSDDSKKTTSSSTPSSVDLGCIIEYRADEEGNLDYVDVDFNTLVTEKDVRRIMQKLRLNHYTATSCGGDFTLSKCRALFERDYRCEFICRSGTITVRKSAVYETARQIEPPKDAEITTSPIRKAARFLRGASSRGCRATSQLLAPCSMERIRDIDAQIIRDLKIQYICDLMVEDRKMFKQVIRVSSSEKINKDIYCDLSIEQMPYPGCKMFKYYHEAQHIPEGLVFDWNRPDVNAEMMFSEDPKICFPRIDWLNYKEWDLVKLTQNYLRMMLYYLAKGHDGLLVHCISGWDRTPLFISILRASLWVDGVIHESLAYKELAYLMLAYDWYLFGHDFPNRLRKGQEIMHFCFKFLPYIISDEFSITRIYHELPPEQRRKEPFKVFVPGRRESLHFLSVYVLGSYFDNITMKME